MFVFDKPRYINCLSLPYMDILRSALLLLPVRLDRADGGCIYQSMTDMSRSEHPVRWISTVNI